MDEFTPTTDQVRETWAEVQDITFGEGLDAHEEEFNRWLKAQLADVWDQAVYSLRDFMGLFTMQTVLEKNPYRTADS